MRLLVGMIGLWAVSAWADDLPTNLLLKCEGKVSVISSSEGSRPNIDGGKFETMLRLKDGDPRVLALSPWAKLGLNYARDLADNAREHCPRALMSLASMQSASSSLVARLAVLLLVERLGVESARGRSNTGQNRQGEKC